MKVPYAASMAALTGLSLLVPSAYGMEFFNCGDNARFLVSLMMGFGSRDPTTIQRDTDPPYPEGQIYGARRFEMPIQSNTMRSFMVQSISGSQPIRLYEKVSSGWKFCPIEDYDI
ncbi:BgTH12-07821 [Blumeria graminis f. sp. triticale]|uniref:BgtE-20027 n=3 Tax=Blumeria graminis TaxID=34373 RepID=A0A9X9MQ20_BLUGR|nr:BgTH12-07821 [Blumeria graminis f. sp. triticale]VDB96455.1 BgtE-20027 [Blumeria graminis f. sp. tritici]